MSLMRKFGDCKFSHNFETLIDTLQTNLLNKRVLQNNSKDDFFSKIKMGIKKWRIRLRPTGYAVTRKEGFDTSEAK
jgi:hypothetical protein